MAMKKTAGEKPEDKTSFMSGCPMSTRISVYLSNSAKYSVELTTMSRSVVVPRRNTKPFPELSSFPGNFLRAVLSVLLILSTKVSGEPYGSRSYGASLGNQGTSRIYNYYLLNYNYFLVCTDQR